MSTLQKKHDEIRHKLEIHSYNSSQQSSLRNSVLEQVKQEQNEHKVALNELERRWDNEQEQTRIDIENKELKRQRESKAREFEEREYFASLWIQLRWKAYLKRKALKKTSTKAKGKKKGKKKTL